MGCDGCGEKLQEVPSCDKTKTNACNMYRYFISVKTQRINKRKVMLIIIVLIMRKLFIGGLWY